MAKEAKKENKEGSELTERSLVLIKPDGVYRGLIGEVIKRFEFHGLKLVGLKLIRANLDLVGKHYKYDVAWLESVGKKSKEAYSKLGININKKELEIGEGVRSMLMEYITSGPVVAMVLEGPHAVEMVRKIVGPTEPKSAPLGTIRGDFSVDSYPLSDSQKRPIKNIIHCSGSVAEAKEEISVWFSPNEICIYDRPDEFIAYRKTW